MKKVFTIITAIVISCVFNIHLLAQWTQLTPPSVNHHYYCVKFTDVNTGYAVGFDGVFIKTTNGGTNWTWVNIGAAYTLNACWFYNSSTGWIVGDYGIIKKTTNSGFNWTTYTEPTNTNLNSVYFINHLTGWAAGNLGIILKTTDGGNTWNSQTLLDMSQLKSIYFINSNTGIMCGTNIYKSTNGGLNWTTQLNAANVRSVFFVGDNTGWAAGILGNIIKTTNQGNSWPINQNVGITVNLNCVNFYSVTTGWVVGENRRIFKTTNGGTNWYEQPNPISAGTTLRWVDFLNGNTGWIVGYNGAILKTTDGGGPIGIERISSEVPANFSLLQNYPNPFNPSTKIRMLISKLSEVKLAVYDITGREAAILVNEQLKPGIYEVEWNASGFASGMYLYKLTAEKYNQTRKMILIE